MIKRFLKLFLLLILPISIFAYSDRHEYHKTNGAYEFSDYYKNQSTPDGLIYDVLSNSRIEQNRYLLTKAEPHEISTITNKFKDHINDLSNMIIRMEYGDKIIPYSQSTFMTDEYDYINDGFTHSGLIRFIYNTASFRNSIALRQDTLNDIYDQLLDSGSKLPKIGLEETHSNWKGTIPNTITKNKDNTESSQSWTILNKDKSNVVITRPNTGTIYLNNIANNGSSPFLLTNNTLSSVKPGDLIMVDLLNDGHIDFGGVAYNETISGGSKSDKANKFIFMKVDKEGDTGYVTSRLIPITTKQTLQLDPKTKESIDTQHTVVVIPFEVIVATIARNTMSRDLLEYLDTNDVYKRSYFETTKKILEADRYLRWTPSLIQWINPYDGTLANFDPYNKVYPNLLKYTQSKPTVEENFKINADHTIELTLDDVKKAIEDSENPNHILKDYLDKKNKEEITNGKHDYVVDKFTAGLTFLPTILLILITALFLLDFMIMGLKEIKNGVNGIDTFLTKAIDKFTRYAVIIVCLYLYPIILRQILYPLFLTHLPIYLVGLDGSNHITSDLTNNNSGSLILSYGKIWLETTRTALGLVLQILRGAFIRFIFSLIKFLFWMIFNPIKAILYLLTKIFITGPMTVACVVGGLFMAINIVANIYMSGIFLVITTSVASLYFVFGTTDAFIDKLLLILQIIFVTFMQFIIQIVLLVIVIGTLNQLRGLVPIYALDDLGDVIPMAITMALIFMIIRIPTKVAKTLEQVI